MIEQTTARCGVISCGREHLEKIPCDRHLLDNPVARPASFRVSAPNGSSFLCCEDCQPKFERNKYLQFQQIARQ